MSVTAAPPVTRYGLECQGITRAFSGVRALKGIDLAIPTGTIHGVVGENGAGKSTWLGIVTGRISATTGRVLVGGEELPQGHPRVAMRAGVAAVYQELSVLPMLRPHENVFIERPLKRGGFVSSRAMRDEYVRVCKDFGIEPAPNVPTGTLAVGTQQLIEIIRAVASQASVLLLDEPTTSLSSEERGALFRLLRRLKAEGTTIVLVSHALEEVLEHSDAVTVFRDGALIETRDAAEWTGPELIDRMLGKSSEHLLRRHPSDTGAGAIVDQGDPLLSVIGVEIPHRLHGVSFDLRRGEVLGVAGLMGSGRTSLMRALAGLEPWATGALTMHSALHPLPSGPRAARRLGIGLLPEDRKGQGISLQLSCADNVLLSDFKRVTRWGLLTERRMRAKAVPLMAAAGVRAERVSSPASALSGGNQQKLLFARMNYQRPTVLLADEPTKGIDVGAKADILDALREHARSEGLGVVLVSSEFQELIAFCDRILVMRKGNLVASLDNTAASGDMEATILRHAFGTDAGSAAA